MPSSSCASAFPVFVFGVALGTLRQTSIQYIVPASNVGDQIAMLLAAGFASVVILVTIVALGGGDKWSRYFRPLVPLHRRHAVLPAAFPK